MSNVENIAATKAQLRALRTSITLLKNSGLDCSAQEKELERLEATTPVIKRKAKEYPPVEVCLSHTEDGTVLIQTPPPGRGGRIWAYAAQIKEAAGKNAFGKTRAVWHREEKAWEVPGDPETVKKALQVVGNFFKGTVKTLETGAVHPLPEAQPRT